LDGSAVEAHVDGERDGELEVLRVVLGAGVVLVPGSVSGAMPRAESGLPCQHDQQALDVLELQAVVTAQQHLVADHDLEAVA
jgi:hypothetical protein